MSGDAPSRLARWAALAVSLVVAAVVIWARWPDSEVESVDVTSTGPRFSSLEGLVAASDIIVIGTIDNASVGRAITDPTDPTIGIRTTLYELIVETTLAGPAEGAVTIEYETALLDGTPVTLDGIEPPRRNERGLYFLVAGTSHEFPYHAIVGPQGRFPISGNTLVALDSDELSRSLDATTTVEITDRVLSTP